MTSKRTTFSGPKSPKSDMFGTLGTLGVQMGAQTDKIIKMTPKITPRTHMFPKNVQENKVNHNTK